MKSRARCGMRHTISQAASSTWAKHLTRLAFLYCCMYYRLLFSTPPLVLFADLSACARHLRSATATCVLALAITFFSALSLFALAATHHSFERRLPFPSTLCNTSAYHKSLSSRSIALNHTSIYQSKHGTHFCLLSRSTSMLLCCTCTYLYLSLDLRISGVTLLHRDH